VTPEAPAQVRVFAALELPPELCHRLSEAVTTLEAVLTRGGVRWAQADGMHVTLKFYGDVASAKLIELQAALRQAAEGNGPMALELQGLGVFPNPVHPRVIWVGVGGEVEKLRGLYQRLEQASAGLGFRPEARGFTPHITLGRVKAHLRPQEREALADALARQRSQAIGAFTAQALSLMRSHLRPTGAEYTRLFAAPLGGQP
jgi:RNA 2',3'-cyclic 3'-phosphodiesterase